MRALLSGLGIGITLGVLFAPNAGKATRNIARTRMSEWFRWDDNGSARHEGYGSRRDPEERTVNHDDEQRIREKMLDKTLADSFPTSDPPSSIPDPSSDSLS
jgi:gas vesicle protein